MNQNWPAEVLNFWFAELTPQAWFTKDELLDRRILSRFLAVYVHLADAATDDAWASSPDSTLAALIVLDQFPRNMFRGTARMFESDWKALRLAHRAHAEGTDQEVEHTRRLFFYLPFEHSEELADQALSVALVEDLGDSVYAKFARDHYDIIARFGRFPHRNALLNRTSTAEELAFLAEPGSSF